MRRENRDSQRSDNLQAEIDKNFQTIITGGPLKHFSKQKRIIPFSRPASLPSPTLISPWFIELCQQLRSARMSQGLTQRQLAQKVQTTQKLICLLENGKANPTAEILDRICEQLGVKIQISII